ncbi:protein SLC31A2-like [Oscarella lobularis]|uniref:protein SLC31A2-like n=1 Tax=Oscarella lobularis TaxID=121494 RepID=UPI003313E508
MEPNAVFHFGFESQLLFQNWKAETTENLVGSCLSVFSVSILYELLKSFRSWLADRGRQKPIADVERTNYGTQTESTSLLPSKPQRRSTSWPLHAIQTFLHVIEVLVSFSLMLVVMTCNAWLFLSIVLGSTLGYFVFGKRREASRAQTPMRPLYYRTDTCHP